ncbi:MAG: amidophosphoribosyltransferase [Planctomycetes bacterium]|nr:amidophosphoribosyltransferase [Planctomycetota bacterium]
MCGLFGIWGDEAAADKTYLGLFAQQHRGQESAGLATTDGHRLQTHRGMGLLPEALPPEALRRLKNRAAIGHVRYSTTGSSNLANAQPLVVNCRGGEVAVAHNGNLVNSRALRDEMEARGSIFQTTTDSELVLHLMAHRNALQGDEAGLDACLARLEGAWSLLILMPGRLVGVRDPHGFRPLVLGRTESGARVLASETCALDQVGAALVREVEPGEVVTLDDGGLRSRRYAPATPRRCLFEHVYFARPDSVLFGDPVHEVRKLLGRRLAREHPVAADAVIAIPDSGNSAALGYSLESGIPLEVGFMRNHYVGRTFIQPSPDERSRSVDLKLNVIESSVQGKRVVVVDDSIIRGNTSRRRVARLRAAGAREVHMRISCPPTVSPCHYGIDFTSTTELIASTRSVEAIARVIGVDSLGYLSLEGMRSCVGGPQGSYCTACWTREYPVAVPQDLDRHALEARMSGRRPD